MFGLFRRQNANVCAVHLEIDTLFGGSPPSPAAFERFAAALQGPLSTCPADYRAATTALLFALRQCLKVEQARAQSTGWGNAGRRFLAYLFGGTAGVAECLDVEQADHAACDATQENVFVPQVERRAEEYHKVVKKYL
jgi:hypothetical protein